MRLRMRSTIIYYHDEATGNTDMHHTIMRIPRVFQTDTLLAECHTALGQCKRPFEDYAYSPVSDPTMRVPRDALTEVCVTDGQGGRY